MVEAAEGGELEEVGRRERRGDGTGGSQRRPRKAKAEAKGVGEGQSWRRLRQAVAEGGRLGLEKQRRVGRRK